MTADTSVCIGALILLTKLTAVNKLDAILTGLFQPQYREMMLAHTRARRPTVTKTPKLPSH